MERRELLKSYDEIKVIISQSSELFGFIQHVVAVVRICHYQTYITISLMLILQDVFHFHQKIHYYDDDNVWVKRWGDDNVTRVWDFFIFSSIFRSFFARIHIIISIVKIVGMNWVILWWLKILFTLEVLFSIQRVPWPFPYRYPKSSLILYA